MCVINFSMVVANRCWVLCGLMAATAQPTCDLAGTWTTGYAPNYAGGAEPATPVPVHSRLEVVAAVTPFGSPPAQYVTDAFGVAALALHPNWQTCLGNGTCSTDAFGNARALNADAPPCSFIEWPASAAHAGGSWCKAPLCTPPTPPPPPPAPPTPQPVYPRFNVTWEPTYDMSRSTITNPNGSPLGPDTGALLKVDSSFGIIAFDGGDMACENYRLGPPEDPCKYAKTWTSLYVLRPGSSSLLHRSFADPPPATRAAPPSPSLPRQRGAGAADQGSQPGYARVALSEHAAPADPQRV